MDILFWRHCEAHDIDSEVLRQATVEQLRQADHQRTLTERGHKQAQRMGRWLDEHTAQDLRVLCSPAKRCIQTAEGLGRKSRICSDLSPSQDLKDMLNLIGEHKAHSPLLLVGHQPVLGQAIAAMLGLETHEFSVRKGAVWWLRKRTRMGDVQTVLYTVQTPDML